MRSTRLGLLFAVVASSSIALAQRLPQDVHPEHYKVHFTPDLQTATFTGEETVNVRLDAPSNQITLNAVELQISRITASPVTANPGLPASGVPATVTFDEAKQQATFHFAQELPAGEWNISMDFKGILNDKLRGFYLSKTAKRRYAVTQFESTDARRAFPNFDEPAMKATFDLSLTIDKGDTVIANTQQIDDTPSQDGLKHTMVFSTTPKMSTYLLAFQVGDFQCSKGQADGVIIRACATPDQVKNTQFAVTAAEHFLHYYNTYFGVRYPLDKLDMIGIPDFEAGAMENFGCITYRETDLLVDAKDAPLSAQQRVATVVAHEMAHQWFGDLVTMEWWNNVWLNEGFASWMESKAVNDWKPEWKLKDDDASSLDGVLGLDAQTTTHPIRAVADTPEQIEEMFDGISYEKGSAVIGMVEHYLGEETFRQGVQAYLKAHLYANATAEDFWNAQTQTSGKPVDKIMSSFVEQPGVPLLHFGDANKGKIDVSQKRFNVAGSEVWTIPVCVRGGSCELVSPTEHTISAPVGYLYANADYKGYYRSAYTDAAWKKLMLHVSDLSSPERIGLVGDRWALVRSNDATIASYLDMVHALREENNASVLSNAWNAVGYVRNHLASQDQTQKLNAWTRRDLTPAYNKIRKEQKGESLDVKERRRVLFALLGGAGDPAVLKESKKMSDRFFHNDPSLDPSIALTAIALTASHGSAADYDRTLDWSRKATDSRSRMQGYLTLANFNDPALVERTVELAGSGEVRNQDNWILISTLMQRSSTRDLAWGSIQKNWDSIQKTLTVSSGQRIVSAMGSFCSDEKANEVDAFFKAHPVQASDRTLKKALSTIHACSEFQKTQADSLTHWLSENAAASHGLHF